MTKLIAWLTRVSILSAAFLFVTPASTQVDQEKYIYEFAQSRNIQGAADLIEKLEREISKVLAAGHLAPFYALYGEIDINYYWYRRFETVYALSLAYPHVNPQIQSALQEYLRSELIVYPVWVTEYGSEFLKTDEGTRRNPDLNLNLSGESAENEYQSTDEPKLFGIYALWVYAHNTGDWQYIEQNWDAIKNFYHSNRGETSQYYQSIAGAIGMARLAAEKPNPDPAIESTAKNDALDGLSAGIDFDQFVQIANTTLFSGDDWRREETFMGFVFQYLTPEVLHFVNDTPALKIAMIGTGREAVSFAAGEKLRPIWYLAQAPHWSRWYGEGWAFNYEIRSWFFPYHRWLLKDSPQKLRLYVDVPDALVGDSYYIANLASAIEAHGQTCWVDIRTGQETGCEPPPKGSPLSS